VRIDAPLIIGVSATGRFSGNITGSGNIETRAGSRIRIDGTASISVNGAQMMVGSVIEPGDTRDARGLAPELFNNSVIRGVGSIGLNGLKITNNGTIRADEGTAQVPGVLWIDPSPEGLLNAGIMESTNFGALVLSGSGGGAFDQQGTALIRALGATSNVRLAGTQVSVTGGQLGAGLGSISVDGGTTATLSDLTSDALLSTSGLATIVINNNVINTGTVSLPGAARLVVAGASTLNSASGHILNNGSITVTNNGNLDANFIDGTGTVLVQTGGTLRAHAIRQGRLTINDGAFAHVKSAFTGSADPSRVGSLSIGAAPAFLDVANRVLIIDQSGTVALNTLRSQIISGYNGGAWDGPGIRSSSAAANPGHAVGYGEASAIFSTFPATYFGQTIDNTTVLVTYTRYGDANLDRIVNLSDFNRLAANFGLNNRLWTDGDSTYDGVVNLADFNQLAANFGLVAVGSEVTPQDWAALAAVVPEPPLAELGMCLGALVMRRLRRAS
jgi:hypothetical protein